MGNPAHISTLQRANLKVIEMQHTPDTSRLLSRVLSRPAFTAIAKGENPERVFKSIYESGLVTPGLSINALYKMAFDVLHSNYRNEYIYKSAIANKIIFGRHSPRTASLSIELQVAKSIVDTAIFNGTSTAYEIKTEFDTPRRLATQTPDYLKAFDQVYIVTHPDFVNMHSQQIDERVGLISLDKKDVLRVIKPAISNKDNIDPRTVFRILRRDEYVSIIERARGEKIDLPNGLISSYCEENFITLSKELIHAEFVSAMRKRTTQNHTMDFIKALPKHLRVLGYSAQLSTPQKKRILEKLDIQLE